MLNISSNKIKDDIAIENYQTLKRVESKVSSRVLAKLLTFSSIVFFVVLFLPWTQNVRSKGSVTTLKPNQKPQTINTIIPGRIEKWYIQEGDWVKKGDTIVKLSETKDAYLDPELIELTQKQLDLNVSKTNSYKDKIVSQNNQLRALKNQRDLKLEQNTIKLQQLTLKIQNDSMNYLAARSNYDVAKKQFDRQDSLYNLGLKSLTDLEKRNLKLQETNSYFVSAKNKWLNTKSDLINLKIETTNIKTKYQNDASKIQAEIFSSLSNQLETESSVNKLKNTFSNYSIRQGMYYVLAPQDGYITKTFYSGIGETIKENSPLASIMPDDYQLAIALYIEPVDLPLIQLNGKVLIQFDGWPAIVFSGWPNASYGTYQGEVYAIDQYISENGKYRILVKEDSTEYAWPDALRYGGGTSNMMLLKNVPIWYELWRKINGFPPDYYRGTNIVSKGK
ncbi:MAG: HlyD family secretion protein [Flavobacteriales bacterium]